MQCKGTGKYSHPKVVYWADREDRNGATNLHCSSCQPITALCAQRIGSTVGADVVTLCGRPLVFQLVTFIKDCRMPINLNHHVYVVPEFSKTPVISSSQYKFEAVKKSISFWNGAAPECVICGQNNLHCAMTDALHSCFFAIGRSMIDHHTKGTPCGELALPICDHRAWGNNQYQLWPACIHGNHL